MDLNPDYIRDAVLFDLEAEEVVEILSREMSRSLAHTLVYGITEEELEEELFDCD